MKVTNTFNARMVEQQVKAAIGLYADTAAKKMEGAAKKSRPWTDRTSDAKNSILGSFGWEGNKVKITLSGNMDHSVFLELANENRYAILVPTIQSFAPDILKGYKKVVG